MAGTINSPGATCDFIYGTVCGNLEQDINLASIKCPICGAILNPSGMELGEDTHENMMMTEDHYRDDFGTPHMRVWGRTRYENNQKIHMSCPNRCVEQLTLNIKNVTIGPYREFTEHRR